MSFESFQHSGSLLLSGLRCSGTGDVMYIDSYSPKNEIGGGSATPLYTAPVRLAVLFVFIFYG